MRKFLKNNWAICLELVLFSLIITGVLPRSAAFGLAGFLVIYSLMMPLEDVLVLFVQSIPLFIALPFSGGHDNFNTWRIISIIIFGRWLVSMPIKQWLRSFIPEKKEVVALNIVWLLALASVLVASDQAAAVKRIIYFANLALVPVVLTNLLQKRELSMERIIRAMAVPTVIVLGVGFIQLISTYLIDVYQFMRIWGEEIQLRQFGEAWSYIAVNVGNTWLAYYGAQLSLRVFSLFTDSHTFPLFLILGLPAIFAMALSDMVKNTEGKLKKLYLTRSKLMIFLVPMLYLMAILSGTRGIWAASVGVVLGIIVFMLYMRRQKVAQEKRSIFIYIASYLVLFFLLFAVAYPIFVSPQFLLSKGDWALLGNRIKSIFDFGETSNAQRILIWKQSLTSIGDHPILGVGIGNFPVVLNQNINLAKAGSSAHNLYLHVTAELGIPALLAALYFLGGILWRIYQSFLNSRDSFWTVYSAAFMISWVWVFLYVMTDVAIFDERLFLMLGTSVAIALSHD